MKKNFGRTEFGGDIDKNENKEDAWKLEQNTPRSNFGMKVTADEMDVATEPCFGENENG